MNIQSETLRIVFEPRNVAKKCVEVLSIELECIVDQMKQTADNNVYWQLFTYKTQLERIIENRLNGSVIN